MSWEHYLQIKSNTINPYNTCLYYTRGNITMNLILFLSHAIVQPSKDESNVMLGGKEKSQTYAIITIHLFERTVATL